MEEYGWSEPGRQLLKHLTNLANSVGGQPLLACHIIWENPEYFRVWSDRNEAYKNINKHYVKKRRYAQRIVKSKQWTGEELSVIRNTMNLQWKDIKLLLPNRTQGAVYHRRCVVRAQITC